MHAHELAALLPDQVPHLLRFAQRLTRTRADAEDLVQETLIRAMERAESFRGESSLATWLHRIQHNLAVDAARRRREVPVEDLSAVEAIERKWAEDEYTVDAEALVARAETREELEDALVHLPLDYRAAVVLHDAEGLTVPEVAEIQGVSLPAAKQRVRRGRMMLLDELARGHERRHALRGVPLRCWDARSQVSDFLDGELDASAVAFLQRHIQGCPTCPPLVTALIGTREALARTRRAPATGSRRDPDSVIPPGIAARLAALHGSGASDVPGEGRSSGR
ncbi:MAG: sigma-70 family RNA polymerase sigma factor [Kineosporiaceae bacterium]|nr:sigma-70 family RNA polymerase sigma factor [Kineosporiaceae bacterium]